MNGTLPLAFVTLFESARIVQMFYDTQSTTFGLFAEKNDLKTVGSLLCRQVTDLFVNPGRNLYELALNI